MLSFVSEEINKYSEIHSTLPSPLSDELFEYTQKNVEYPIMLSGPLVASFLGFLIQSLKVKRVLEIGTYTGYSALTMAENLPNDGKLITLDINDKFVSVGKKFWQKSVHGEKITSILGPALETIKVLEGGFDFVFIDADKTNYSNYLKAVLPLLSKNGIIVADNCLWAGRVLDSGNQEVDTVAIRNFNKLVHSSKDLQSMLLPLRDGLHLIRKR